MPLFKLVQSANDALAYLDDGAAVGLDTEFMREKTFFAQLCLVQLSTPNGIVCIDPLRDDDQRDLWAALAAREWVVHSARQDLEVLYQTASTLPGALFDTQIAAALTGHAPQLGYAGLVHELFDIELPKTHTRANWQKRPIKREFLDYAAEDVEHLLPARDVLTEQLDKLGRLEWVREDSASLLDRDLYAASPANAIDRLKGARNLKGRRRSAAALLAGWREQRAIDRDRPRQWIIRDSVLLDIAWRLPTSRRQLQSIADLPPKLLERHGSTLVDLVQQASDEGYRPPSPPSEAQKALLKTMQAAVAAAAKELGLAAEIIAPKKDLSAAIMDGDRSSRVFSGWRLDVIGKDLLEML